eukprot:scaffold34780_cov84-Isochrysis_galbana.AAC.1
MASRPPHRHLHAPEAEPPPPPFQSRLSGAMSSRGLAPSLVRVSLVSRSPVLMPQHTPAIRAAFAAILTRRGIEVLTGEEVTGAVPPVDEAAEPKREMWCGAYPTQPTWG